MPLKRLSVKSKGDYLYFFTIYVNKNSRKIFKSCLLKEVLLILYCFYKQLTQFISRKQLIYCINVILYKTLRQFINTKDDK